MLTIDRSLLEPALGGDRRAQNRLVAVLRPYIEKRIRRFPLADEDRRDVAQSALLQIARHLDSFRGDACFTTWAFRVATNEALMSLRAQKRHVTHLVHGMSPDAVEVAGGSDDDDAVDGERRALVRDALDGLTPEHQYVIVAYYQAGLTIPDIARELAITETAARSRLHRARKMLRQELAA